MSLTGERLRTQRKRLEMSADEIAAELGVSRSTIFRYENGYIEKVPSNILEKLADILYTTPAYLAGWTDDYHDWERIGNDEGIYPPKDFNGDYEDFVKNKILQESDDLCDSYSDLYDNAVKYLESINCKIISSKEHNILDITSPVGRHFRVKADDLVHNYMIYGATKPGLKKLITHSEILDLRKDEEDLLVTYNRLNSIGKKEAIKRIEELSMIALYAEKQYSLNAAHERTDIEVTDEMRQHDDDIMDNDSEWE